MNSPALRCVDLVKTFNGSRAVSALSLEVEQGEVLALLGPSGCGKTTTLRLIAGFESPNAGTIEVGGKLVASADHFVPPEKRHIGMVFQDYALFPHLSVEQNVAYGMPKNTRRDARIRTVLSLVGLYQVRSRMPHELSGGEQQRVALARALVPSPAILLLDEPFSNLDAKLRQQVREEVKEVLEFSNTSALFVTHDQEEALYMGDRVAVLNRGYLEQVGPPEEIYQSPATFFIAQFVGRADFLAVTFRDGVPWTEAGPLSGVEAPAAAEDIEVMVRPEDVKFKPSEGGQGRIIARTFQGAYTLYRVLLDSGEAVHSMKSHMEGYAVGTRVLVGLEPNHRLIFFKDGKAVTEGDSKGP